MTASRARLVFAILLALSAGASGQTEPASPPVATGAPTPIGGGTQPEEPEATPAEFKPGMFGKPAQTAITSSEIGIVDGPPVGVLDDANGGLGLSMWVNAPRGEVEDLLTRIPLVSADPFARALSRRIVLTISEAPVGPAKRALVTIRIEKLLQAGLIDEAGVLAASLRLDNDPDFARAQADALLYAGRDKDICSDLTAARLSSPDTFWLELRIYCFASAGDHDAAELAKAALDTLGKDAAFDLLLADVLENKKAAPASIDHPTALHVFLLRKIGLPIANGLAAKLGTAANLLAAREARNPAADRLSAAARISGTGALSLAEQLALLNAQDIPADQIAQVQTVAEKLTFLPGQALLRRATTLETRPPTKVDLLLAALSAGGHVDRLPQTAGLQGDLALAIKPDIGLARGRFLISRALILNGRADAAAAWYANAPSDMDHAAFAILLDLAAPSPARDGGAQAAYAWLAKNAAPQQNPAPIAALALGMADVLGRPMPPDAKALAGTLEGMRWAGARPSAENMRRLAEAASQPGRKGEAILRILDMAGADGPADLPPDLAIECVRMLQQMGLAAEAHALAIETLAMARP